MNIPIKLIKPTPKCYLCGKIGHWDCYDKTEIIPKLLY